jgi:MFS family permease
MTEEPAVPEPAAVGAAQAPASRLGRIALDTRPLRHRGFRNLWLGATVSTIGGMIGTVAVPYQMYSLTHSTLAVGALGIAALVPLLVVPFWGGALADSADRRTVLFWSELGMAAVTGLFLLNAAIPHPQAWALYVLEALAVTIFSFHRPASSSLTPRLVPDDEIAAAWTLQSASWNFAAVGGPAVGGVVIAAVGISATYAIDTATYAASLVTIWALPSVPPREQAARPSVGSVLEGLRFLRGRQAMLGSFAMDTNAMVFGMPNALFPALALHHFGGGPRTVGYLYAAPYAGALAGSLLSGWTGKLRRQGIGVSVLASTWGVAIACFGVLHDLWPALALLAVAGAADFYSGVLRTTMLMRGTPDHLRGRIAGVEFVQVASAANLGDLEAGVVAALTSLRASVVSGGVLCVAGCLVTLALLPGFRRYDASKPLE